MSDVSTISAELRTEFGKGGARRTRRAGKVPAVLYGHGDAPKHLSLPALAFATAIRHGGMTHVLTVDISDGTKVLALPKAVQRDPIKNTYIHVDLQVVRKGEQVTVEVPVQLVGESVPGTLVMHETDRLAVTADATKLPDYLEASVAGLDVGGRVTAADLELPVGTELATDPGTVIAMVGSTSTVSDLETEAAEAEAGPATTATEPSLS